MENYNTSDTIRVIKIVDIGFISIIYFLLGLYIAIFINKVMGKYDHNINKSKTTCQLLIELSIHIWGVGVLAYLARIIVRLIPFPLDNFNNFDHSRLREIPNASPFIYILLLLLPHIRGKTRIIYDRFVK
jgi:hypothetical protein